MDYDIAVIGGGPGGYVAAIRAAQLGAKVLLVEKEKLGGVCLNWGCIPTKTLLKSAEKWRELKECGEFGLRAENTGFDYALVRGRMKRVVEQMQQGILQLIKSNAIDFRVGTAILQGKNQIAIELSSSIEQVTAKAIILATGSHPMRLPVPGGEVPAVINSNELLTMTEVPQSMVVVGAGAVGIEFASILQSFGCQVTVVEMLPSILPSIDQDIVKRMSLILRKQGIKVLTGTRIVKVVEGHEGIIVQITDGTNTQEIRAEKVLSAIGRLPAVEGLGLESAGLEYSRKGIKVNAKMETNVPGIYAIGDVTGQYMLAHAASAAGIAAAENALGQESSVDYRAIPACVFTSPEIAMVGLTEQEAKGMGKEIKVSKFNFAANGKAVSMGEAEGLVKIVADSADGKVLGMHILGPHASDLIMEGALAVKHGLSARDIAYTIHPHPSLSETVMECAHGIDGDIIHQVKLKASR